MKIGILTFHWGTNYGGVLQSYALQEFLKNKNFDVEIINYAPKTLRDSFYLCFKTRSFKTLCNNISLYLKEKKIKKFRSKYLNLSKRYNNINDFIAGVTGKYDAIIVGSDQVWNPYIAETYGKVYWLPLSMAVNKIAYAVSLGCTKYPVDLLSRLSKYINDFNYISVREHSAVDIIQKVYRKDSVFYTPDPVVLPSISTFQKFIINNKCVKGCFIYILQDKQKLIKEIELLIQREYKVTKSTNKLFSLSIEDWLSSIFNNDLIITNSFHGVMFSILFHKNFYVIPIEGKLNGMNDRIYTILSRLGLETRLIENLDQFMGIDFKKQLIDWKMVDSKMVDLRNIGENFILNALKNETLR